LPNAYPEGWEELMNKPKAAGNLVAKSTFLTNSN